MKGKIAFVLGASIGYVLGSRAGRERYEQIRRAADSIWHTAPVQRGVSCVKKASAAKMNQAKDLAKRVGADAVGSLMKNMSSPAHVDTPSEQALPENEVGTPSKTEVPE